MKFGSGSVGEDGVFCNEWENSGGTKKKYDILRVWRMSISELKKESKMKYLPLFVLMICTFFMSGCGKSEQPIDSATEAELKNIIQRNLKGNQEENMEMALMDLDDGLKSGTETVMKDLFAKYDLSYKLVSFKVLHFYGDTAEVEVVQETRKISGPDFADNVITAVHTLKKRPSGWKFTASKITSFKKI